MGVHSADPAGLQQVRKTVHGWSPWPQGRPGGGLPWLCPAWRQMQACVGAGASPVGLSILHLLLSAALVLFLAERKNLWLICE